MSFPPFPVARRVCYTGSVSWQSLGRRSHRPPSLAPLFDLVDRRKGVWVGGWVGEIKKKKAVTQGGKQGGMYRGEVGWWLVED